MMGIAFWCVWAAYNTPELPETAAATMMSPEVAADAAEPPEVVALVAVFPEAMVPAAVSPEVAAHAAEPFETAVLASAPCVNLAPSNALSAHHVTVEGTVDEHCSCAVKETVNELPLFFYGYRCRTSRGGSIRCRTSRGVSGIFSSTRCLSCLSYGGHL